MSHSPIIIVSGLPRSGTSLMMQMLSRGGFSPLTDELRAADESNPRGYFEFERVKQLRTDRSWLPEARGRVVKIIHVLLRALPTDGSFHYRVILMRRALPEVLASQRVMLEREGKRSADTALLTTVYEAQLAQTEQWLSDHQCFAWMPVEYHRVLREPHAVADEIRRFLGCDLDLDAMAAAIDPALYRQRAEG